MTDLRKAAEMALEALEEACEIVGPAWSWRDEKGRPTAQALRQALAQPSDSVEQEPVSGKGKEFSEQLKLCARNVAFAASGHVDMSLAAMQEMFALIDHVCTGIDSPPALAQPEQKPVAFYVYKPTLPHGNLGNVSDGDLPWVYDQDPSSGYSARMIVYTAPPKREWSGLSVSKAEDLLGEFENDPYEMLFALDKYLREKNSA